MTALQVLHQVLGRLPLPISLSKFFYTIFAGPIILYAGEPVCVPVRASPRPCRASKRKKSDPEQRVFARASARAAQPAPLSRFEELGDEIRVEGARLGALEFKAKEAFLARALLAAKRWRPRRCG